MIMKSETTGGLRRTATRFFPFLEGFDSYDRNSLKADAVAGLTVALVLIPQSMAYAQLAGLPSYYGLYASFLPPLVAALFGSSRQLATGPVAVVSLLTAATLEPLAAAGSNGYIAYAIVLTLLVGAIQFLLGVLRLGIVINFLSLPVINGFTNAAALIIATSQLPNLFGVHVDKADQHYHTVIRVIQTAWNGLHWPTLLMGFLAFSITYGLKRLSPKIPGVLVAVVITSLLSWGFDFHKRTTAHLSSIQSEEAARLINGFNQEITAILSFSEERSALNHTLTGMGRDGDPLSRLDVEHRIRVISVHIQRHRDQADRFRKRLRNLTLEGVYHPSGAFRYYPKDRVPDLGRRDGRTWRITVGRQALDPDQLTIHSGGAVVGSIPGGLPPVSVPSLDPGIIPRLIPFAAIISLLGFMEAISIAKAMSAKTGQHLDPNQELIGQGLANIFGSLTHSYPVSGSFSRSAINLQNSAVSGLSGVFTGLSVAVVLFFFTPLLYHLPQSVLAAIILLAVIDLINVSGFVHTWRAQWYDGAISIIAFASTLIFAPHLDKGIFIGVGLSLLVFLYKSMHPAMASLSLYEDEALHDAVSFCLKECRFLEVVRFDGPLFFANAQYLEDQINDHITIKKELKHIIVYANSINDLDATGEETLSLVVDRIRSAGLDISFAGVNRSVMTVLKRTHLMAKIGEDHFYPTIDKAIQAVHEKTHNESEEAACPLTSVCRLPTSI